jgi:hypothetical protein
MSELVLKAQEIPLDDPLSACMFEPSQSKPFLATPAAINAFGNDRIVPCLLALQKKARQHKGLDYLQVFEDAESNERLWFIEDGEGGAITALLPSDY